MTNDNDSIPKYKNRMSNYNNRTPKSNDRISKFNDSMLNIMTILVLKQHFEIQ